MSRLFYHVMQDNAGNLLFGVTGTMRLAGTGTLATIYGDEALAVPIPNPMTNHPSYGSFKCYLGSGSYDFQMAKAGYTFETLTGMQGGGSMANQEANAVAITGGSVNGVAEVGIGLPDAGYALDVVGDTRIMGLLGVGTFPLAGAVIGVHYDKDSNHGLLLRGLNNNAGARHAVVFNNASDAVVGTITTNASTTAYNTTSDARLKTAVQNLVGELALIRALRPVRFRWVADDSEGVGFLAGEVAEHVQGVVTGEPDAVDEEGHILPQQIDLSKLVPWLCGALQTLAGQVETLTERVQALEEGLGV